MAQADGGGFGMNGMTQSAAEQFLFLEALLLDQQNFTQWLDLFADDAVFWMPCWKEDGELSQDPDKELSLIYYRGKSNLVDRVDRLRSGLSPASRILPRVAHQITNVALKPQEEAGHAVISSVFCVHAFDPRSDVTRIHFGNYRHQLRQIGGTWLITEKYIRLCNDIIPTVLDVNAI
jgi:3-phenylpropionate/cinnamic acid dioxygenase small subunit